MQLPVSSFIKNDPTIILRITLFVILIMHSIPGMIDGGVNAFGTHYLNEVGFAPAGVPLAWAIKLSHVACAVLLLINRYINVAAIITIIILIAGIVMVHFKEGWYVVGGGRNGYEFNLLLISVLLYLMVRSRK
jgi:putative oxidoreductase